MDSPIDLWWFFLPCMFPQSVPKYPTCRTWQRMEHSNSTKPYGRTDGPTRSEIFISIESSPSPSLPVSPRRRLLYLSRPRRLGGRRRLRRPGRSEPLSSHCARRQHLRRPQPGRRCRDGRPLRQGRQAAGRPQQVCLLRDHQLTFLGVSSPTIKKEITKPPPFHLFMVKPLSVLVADVMIE